jgi:hypothetical protein
LEESLGLLWYGRSEPKRSRPSLWKVDVFVRLYCCW